MLVIKHLLSLTCFIICGKVAYFKMFVKVLVTCIIMGTDLLEL